MRPSVIAGQRGFTIPELLIGLSLSIVVLAGAFGVLQDAARSTARAASVTDVNQTMRVAMNLILRDLVQAGEGDYALRTGVSIPSGMGTDRIVRPRPAGAQWEFPAAYTVLPAVSPASGLGPEINSIRTDVVTLLYEDRRLDFAGVNPAIADDGASMQFPADFAIDDDAIGIQEGDLIRFGSGAMQEVTEVEGRTVRFAEDADSRLNQRDAPQGTVMALRGAAPSFPVLPVSRVSMITYYIVSSGGLPQLVRRLNYGPERVIAVGVENLQFTWDLVDGDTNPTNVETFGGDIAEGQIRKANIYLSGRSLQVSGETGLPVRASLATQVSLRSMSFVSRYDLTP